MNIAYSILSAASTVEAAVTAEASSGPDPEIAMDTEFQQQQYLIESALRALGEMQRPQPGNANTIFDEQFRTLIDLVPME